MTQSEILLAAIRKNPESDEPRLDYADWVAGYADGRAEFIRMEIEASHLPEGTEKQDLQIKIDELWAQNEEKWLGWPLFRWHHYTRRRGFVERVRIEGSRGDDNWDNIFREPVIDLEISAAMLPSLSARPHDLALLRSLQVFRANYDVPRPAPIIAAIPFRELRELIIHWIDLGPDDISEIVASQHFEKLEILNLNANPIGDAGASILAKSPLIQQLKLLDVRYCEIGAQGIEELQNSFRHDDQKRVLIHES